MANNYFQLKHFTIWQDRCAMKIGTDAILFGAWVNAKGNLHILDIGTGTGILALMLAQRTTGLIEAIDIDHQAAEQARDNCNQSPWADRLNCYYKSLSEFIPLNTTPYDLVVSNPPFFSSGHRSGHLPRALARHHDSLSLEQLIKGAKLLLKPSGRLAVVLPYEERRKFVEICQTEGWWIVREASVRPLPQEEYIRVMMEVGAIRPERFQTEEIIIEQGRRHQYHPTFKEYTIEYYPGTTLD